jgi:hypothetical protein
MPNDKSNPQPQKPPQDVEIKSAKGEPTSPKPDKNVSVPEYDVLTEGYDPAKLRKR